MAKVGICIECKKSRHILWGVCKSCKPFHTQKVRNKRYPRDIVYQHEYYIKVTKPKRQAKATFTEDRYQEIPDKFKKGKCYENAVQYILTHHDNDSNLLLCHGWVTGVNQLQGVRYSHAWVEHPGMSLVIDPSLTPGDPLIISQFMYYAIGQIKKDRVIKYTYEEMSFQLAEKGTYGPWDTIYDE